MLEKMLGLQIICEQFRICPNFIRETRFSFRWSLAKPASALDGDAQNDILPKKLYGLSWMLSPARVNDDDQWCEESPTHGRRNFKDTNP